MNLNDVLHFVHLIEASPSYRHCPLGLEPPSTNLHLLHRRTGIGTFGPRELCPPCESLQPGGGVFVSSDKLEVLSTDECLTLLDQAKVGRVRGEGREIPEIFPVVYCLLDGAIVFRTGEGTKLHAVSRQSVLAFEVDDFDAEVSQGWSVLVVGRSSEVTDLKGINVAKLLLPDSWVTADRHHVIRISLDRVTGRRITEHD